MPLEIRSLAVGPLQANCHVALDRERGEALVVDPGDEAEVILEAVDGLQVVAIWLTHAHYDHIGGLPELQRLAGNPPTAIHAIEEPWLRDGALNLASWVGVPFTPTRAEVTWQGGEEVELLGRRWRIVHTPGHSPGHVAIVCEAEKVAFSGDLVLMGGVGRTDLPGANPGVFGESLKTLLDLPGETELFTGHGESSTVARERAGNWLAKEIIGGARL